MKQHGTALKSVLEPMLRHGVAGNTLQLPPEDQPMRIVAGDGRSYMRRPPYPGECAAKLADTLHLNGEPRQEFIRCAERL